jgi:hypothetical protein
LTVKKFWMIPINSKLPKIAMDVRLLVHIFSIKVKILMLTLFTLNLILKELCLITPVYWLLYSIYWLSIQQICFIIVVEFIWSVCGPNELGLKRYIHTYSDDFISIYVHILCIFRIYRREQKIVFKTFKEKERHHPRGRQPDSSMTGMRTSGLRVRIRRYHNI